MFSVPSGNFGDMMGGLLAWRMGLPVERFVIATNANDEVPRFLETGVYGKIEPSPRVHLQRHERGPPLQPGPRGGPLRRASWTRKGRLHEQPDMEALRRDSSP